MRHGYRTAQGDFDYEEPDEYDPDEEHPTTCICPECNAWWEWEEAEREPFDEDCEPPY